MLNFVGYKSVKVDFQSESMLVSVQNGFKAFCCSVSVTRLKCEHEIGWQCYQELVQYLERYLPNVLRNVARYLFMIQCLSHLAVARIAG